MSTFKLTVKRVDLIKKVKANRAAVIKRHEDRYGKPTDEATFRKQMQQFMKEVAAYHTGLARIAREAKLDQVVERAKDGWSIRDMLRDTLGAKEPSRPTFRTHSSANVDGFDDVIELLEMSSDVEITLTGVQYDKMLNGQMGGRRY
jgi:hypothetical protein